MTSRRAMLRIVPLLVVGTLLSACSMSGISPAPGPATAAIAALDRATPAGHVPKAAEVPPAPTQVMAYSGGGRAALEPLISHYARHYGVPERLVHRVIVRESNYNPSARNGPYWGLMQILPQTARTMGYHGPAQGLLDADTNMRYAVRYLAGAYVVAGGNEDRAVRHYAAGYYYHARDKGLLERSGLR